MVLVGKDLGKLTVRATTNVAKDILVKILSPELILLWTVLKK